MPLKLFVCIRKQSQCDVMVIYTAVARHDTWLNVDCLDTICKFRKFHFKKIFCNIYKVLLVHALIYHSFSFEKKTQRIRDGRSSNFQWKYHLFFFETLPRRFATKLITNNNNFFSKSHLDFESIFQCPFDIIVCWIA